MTISVIFKKHRLVSSNSHCTPQPTSSSSSSLALYRGFTIVELLVVIVVIGILAAIGIVAYNSIQTKARIAVISSDLSNASKQLGMDNVINGKYPPTDSDANNKQGLKASSGTIYQYAYTDADNSYCLTATNSGLAYMASTANPVPTAGVCPGHTAPGGGSVAVNGGVVTTLAGSGVAGYGNGGSANGSGASAQFNNPNSIAVDLSGNLYVADEYNHRIRKVTPSGVVTTMAGSTYGFADGTVANALFIYPYSVAVDSSGTVYVGDGYSQRLRKITTAGMVTTLAGSGSNGFTDGPASSAQFSDLRAVAVDSSGTIYVADMYNNRIRKVTPAGFVSTLAGTGVAGFSDGSGTNAQFDHPNGIAVDSSGTVYVGDTFNHRIRKITPAGVVTTLAGGAQGFANATGTNAQFSSPYGVAVDSAGTLFVADQNNNRIRKVSPAGVVTTLAGSGVSGSTDGTGAGATFAMPQGITVDSAGAVYVADFYSHRIRKIQ